MSSTRPGPRAARRMAPRLILAAAVFACLMAAALPSSAARADTVSGSVEGSVEGGFGRLVFTFARDIKADVRFGNGVLVVAFAEPITMAVDRLAAAMPGYVGAVRRDPDGRAVRLGLTRKVRVNTLTAGEKLFVDLLPDGWTGGPPGLPQQVIDELAQRAKEAERRVTRLEQVREQAGRGAVGVRVADLPTFVRYLFEIPDSVEVAVMREDGGVRLDFAAPIRFELTDARTAARDVVATIDTAIDGDRASVQFGLGRKVDIRTFREDGAFALDIVPIGLRERRGDVGTAPPPRGEGTAPAPAARPAAAADASKPPSAEPAKAAAAPEAAPARPAPAASPAATPAATPAAAPAAAPAVPARRDPARTGPAPPAAPDAGARSAQQGEDDGEAGPVVVRVQNAGATMRLVFPFRTPTPAAIFRRGETLWLVFDSAVPLDLDGLRAGAGNLVRQVMVQEVAGGRVVRLRLARQPLASLLSEGDGWAVVLGDKVLAPTTPLAVSRSQSPRGDPQVSIALVEPRRLHRLADPDVGDRLLVVTALAPARGFPREQSFVDFNLLSTTHGIAVAGSADDIDAVIGVDMVTLRRPGGLLLSGDATPTGPGEFRNGLLAALDASLWAPGAAADHVARREALTRAAAEAPELQRNSARMRLAQFYMAQGMAAEAKGVVDVVLGSERDQRSIETARALRGLANLMLGRTEAALRDFAAPGYADAQVSMLRSVAMSRQGRFAEARGGLETVDKDAEQLPVVLQRIVLHEAARCALELSDLATAANRLNQLRGLGRQAEMAGDVALLDGRLAQSLNRPEEAIAAYRAAIRSGDAPAAAQARLRMLALQQELGRIGEADAVNELERLTVGWRGDETEVEALSLLGRLYARQGRYRDAFRLMELAIDVHPQSRFTKLIQEEASAVFDKVFLGDEGSGLSPIEAMALFYDFRSLTPPGRRGDEMIRRLADRLVAMDLLSQAGELLQHQIDHRVQGASRARLAARLATIYLMDRRPDLALRALRTTRVADMPAELRRERVLLEARALSDGLRHALALEVIQNLSGPDVDRLRADIHWTARDWRAAAEQMEQLYGTRWQDEAPLDATERSDILRAAVGYALAEDMLGLQRFRERYMDRMPDGPDRRMFAVVTAQYNSGTPEFSEVARRVSAVDTLTAFLRDLRARSAESDAAPGAAGRG